MGERTISSNNSLVQYDNPVLVTSNEDQRPKSGAPKPGCSALEAKRETEEILNAILPPREWEEDGNLWMQQVRSN